MLLGVGAKAENSEVAPVVDVGNGGHRRLQDDLRVVLEEVDLQSAVGEMENNGGTRAEPGSQKRKTHLNVRMTEARLILYYVHPHIQKHTMFRNVAAFPKLERNLRQIPSNKQMVNTA